ncbi:hypothetical protein F7Q99_07260 [Streptomyces kaniharaensis]|uniref:LPXTG cell wall anchor domain-containing protein n=1 Tax=Streptomyces kaniharaensis TaxID=212423 RepID=A0A6N7KNF7_9ACTN|nr:hypothetical protein [Streptomyces kaniharaensis]MQS12099.1 hypothetical protein [Streptomyces kaniharaensis]
MKNQLRVGLVRCGAVALAIAAGTVGASGQALAAVPQLADKAPAVGSYPVYNGSLTASGPTTGLLPGSQVTVSGGGFAPGASVDLSLYSVRVGLGTATADGAGNFTYTVTLPYELKPGVHTIQGVGADARGGTLIETLQITVAPYPHNEHPYPHPPHKEGAEHKEHGKDPDKPAASHGEHSGKHLAETGADTATQPADRGLGISPAAAAVAGLGAVGAIGASVLGRRTYRRTRG